MSQANEGEVHTFAALLAGGANRRYAGQPKALEAVGGEPIAVRAIRALREAAARVVLVANDFDTYRSLGLEMRSDLRPGLGALGGIHTAVCWAQEVGHPGVLVAACDMPFLSAELLRELVRDAGSREVVAPASESRRGLEPLCAWYGSGCRGAIEAALDRGERHVISFFDDVTVRTLPLDEVGSFGDPELMFLNVNTPADRERAERAVRSLEGDAR
ncbi:MAG: molybdenum cofactor guanylyltransferase [Gemmatimonadota bacterium]|nr:MAG: molybdenum cofactor guanylyltransferase [Gemmatimonadota bacterium]